MERELTYIDLFTGAGGLTLGLYQAGWKGIFAVEKNEDAFRTLKHNLILKKNHFNWPDWLSIEKHDINSILNNYKKELLELKGNVTLVAGGPPCQGFSTAGARKENDKRNNLVDSYLDFIKIISPEFVFFENVKGFTYEFKKKGRKGKTFSELIITELEKLKYKVKAKIITFSDYGVPQKRSRFILVASKTKNPGTFFEILTKDKNKFLKRKNLPRHTNLEKAISDLLEKNNHIESPDSPGFNTSLYSRANSSYQRYMRKGKKNEIPDSHRFANHKKQTIEQFKAILKYGERNKRVTTELKTKLKIGKRSLVPLDKNSPTPVLTSHPDDYIHYSEPRILTVREYARIQSFPDWYEFKGKYTTGGKLRKIEVPRYTQIGNAIPPLFAEQVGLALEQMVE